MAAIERELTPRIAETVDLLVKVFRAGKKLLVMGNGGSAADAQHLAAEIVGRFRMERRGLPAIALTTDSSILTALGNDYGSMPSFPGRSRLLPHPVIWSSGFPPAAPPGILPPPWNWPGRKDVIRWGFSGETAGPLPDGGPSPGRSLLRNAKDPGRAYRHHPYYLRSPGTGAVRRRRNPPRRLLRVTGTGRRAVFLDRDGTINVDHGYVFRQSNSTSYRRTRGDPEAQGERISRHRRHQPGRGRPGLYGEADVHELHHYLDRELACHGTAIDAYYYCPHHPEKGRASIFGMCLPQTAPRHDPPGCSRLLSQPGEVVSGW